MKSILSAAYHQCNIFSNHFTYSPSTSSLSPSPSMTITIYHQHHYHDYYHHGLCHHSFHPAINHPLRHAMCPLFVSLCDSVQTYSVIVPAEAVWQPDQLHFDDARACLSLQLQLMASTSEGEQWGLRPLKGHLLFWRVAGHLNPQSDLVLNMLHWRYAAAFQNLRNWRSILFSH